MNNLSDLDFTEIGKVLKHHGYKGELIVHFSVPVKNFKNKERFFVVIDGILVPFFVESIYLKSPARAAVKFKGLTSREEAAELIDGKILTETENLPEEDNHPNDYLIGFQLYDNKKYLGKITRVLSMSSNELLEVFFEEKQKEVLIPYHPELIKKTDAENKKLYCNLPEGLLEIND